MRVVELFAGVGGFRLGLERNGHEVVWANEWDKYAAQTYDKNFGGSIDQRDITKVAAGDIPEHDLICGGFPCQAFSVAGKRRGFAETRGTMFFEIMRIAQHHRTPYLFLENVKGLLNHEGGATYETILETLDELGYDAEWQVLNSKDFGVPQNRERVFIIANLRDRPRPEIFPLGGAEPEVPEAGGDASGRAEAFIKTRHLSQNGTLISDAITLQASETPHIIQRPRGKNDGGVYDIAPTVQQGMGDGNIIVRNPGAPQDRRIYDAAGISPTLSPAAAAGGAVIPKVEIANTLRSSDGGASVRETLVAVAPRGRDGENTLEYRDDDIANALRSAGGGSSKPMVAAGSLIRRLTPIECERLQGFPDDWTAGVSDNQRYKQMGNAVTVNVIEAIAEDLPA